MPKSLMMRSSPMRERAEHHHHDRRRRGDHPAGGSQAVAHRVVRVAAVLPLLVHAREQEHLVVHGQPEDDREQHHRQERLDRPRLDPEQVGAHPCWKTSVTRPSAAPIDSRFMTAALIGTEHRAEHRHQQQRREQHDDAHEEGSFSAISWVKSSCTAVMPPIETVRPVSRSTGGSRRCAAGRSSVVVSCPAARCAGPRSAWPPCGRATGAAPTPRRCRDPPTAGPAAARRAVARCGKLGDERGTGR